MSKLVGLDGKLLNPPKTWERFLAGRQPNLDLAIEYLRGEPVDWGITLIDALNYINRELKLHRKGLEVSGVRFKLESSTDTIPNKKPAS